MSRIALLAAVWIGSSACASHRDTTDSPEPALVPAESLTVTPEQCSMVTSIEVVHRVNGIPVTDRVRLTDDAGGDPSSVLRSFQVAANYFGTANIISSRPISQVQCFPQASAAINPIVKLVDPPLGLCADANGVVTCPLAPPSHAYDYNDAGSCSFTDYTAATSVSCADSSAIVTRNGDVVLTVNTQNLRSEMLARTQALRALLGDANVITNFHFDIVVTPDQQASLVGNDAYANIAQQIKQASDNGQPLPDIQQILHNLPQPPTNVEFYTQMLRAYQTKLDRLQLLAKFTSGALLSPQQVNAFYQSFVSKSRLIDQLDVQHSTSSLNQAAGILNDTITQLATTDRSSTVYNQVKAGAQSVLEAHTSKGVFDPDQTLDFVVPDLYQSLTDDDLEKRLIASQMLVEFNEAIGRDGGKERAAAMAGPVGLLIAAMSNGDMDRVWRLDDQVFANEFFFDNTDPSGTSYDVHLTPDAQAMFNIQAQPNSAVAYEVINVLNETADYNAATGKVTVDYRAVITINARQALTANDIKRAVYHTEESYGVLNFLKSGGVAFLGGALKELGGTVTGIYYTSVALWTDPEAFADHLKSALVNWHQTLDIVLAQGVDVIQRWPNMTLEQKSELLGRIATQVLLTLPPEAKEAGKINEALQEAARLHFDQAARGLAIIERGGVALSEEMAVEIVKRLERYEILTTEDGVKVLDELDDFLPCNLVGAAPFAPGVLSSGSRPPCTFVSDVEKAIETFEVRAQRMGVTNTEELGDLLASGEDLPEGRLVAKKMDADELEFSPQILGRNGGILVGPKAAKRAGIDGFFEGHPMQMKNLPTTSARNAELYISQALSKLDTSGGEHFYDASLYVWVRNIPRDAMVAQLQAAGIASITLDGRFSEIHYLTAGGWIDIVNGIIR